MSAHRSLARLPLEIFESLQSLDDAPVGAAAAPQDLRREIVAKLKVRRFGSACENVGELLRLSPTALLCAVDPLLTYHECQELYRRICLHCAPKPMSALQLLHQTYDTNMPPPQNSSSSLPPLVMRYLPTGIRSLDEHLRGGCRIGTVTEVVGCAATAKTQLAMQMSVLTFLNHSQGSILVDTEKKVSISRLQEIASARAEPGNTRLVLENVTVHSPADMDELRAVLDGLEEEILVRNDAAHNHPVRLLVIDSIAAPARREFGAGSAAAQAATILQIAQTVKRLADQFQLCVLIINQVGSNKSQQWQQPPPNPSTTTTTVSAAPPPPSVKAALGTAWHHCVSTRIQLEHHTTTIATTATGNNATGERMATVVKSNIVGPSDPLGFQVTNRGLVEV